MVCIACAARLDWPLCMSCRLSLRQGPEFLIGGEISVRAAFHHQTTARRLVHRLKYEGLVAAGEVLAEAMAAQVPPHARALIPVPRALVRRVRFGVDPAEQLARLLSGAVGLPVVSALRPAPWWPRHATRRRTERRPAGFIAVRSVPRAAVFVDDVVTSGATIEAARRALVSAGMRDVRSAVAATSPGLVSAAPTNGRSTR
jgi:predicted amidophosphoribosyltransferase